MHIEIFCVVVVDAKTRIYMNLQKKVSEYRKRIANQSIFNL